ncbi:MAG: NAD(P)/FAD-dependent oxidoreductase [Clostridia bacterium]|nr:NAD(P)/FAD-dependent oxidoreductase [Clostridia bacterium]
MKIAVIGSGITGLSTAYYLQKNTGAEVEILEKGSEIGGLAGAFKLGDTLVEKYYHFIYTHDNYYLELIRELGLEESILWCSSKTGYYSDGVVYPFTTALDLLKFKPLSFFNRIRLGLSGVLISYYKNLDKLEQMTTEEFLVKFVGRQGWEKFWKPMLIVKFGDNYNKIPAVWIWERIASRFKSRSGGVNNEVFGYLKGSFQTLNQKLLDTFIQRGGKILLNSDVKEIVIENNAMKGVLVSNEVKKYDYVFFTASLPLFVDLCKNAPYEYIENMKKVKYDCVLIGFLVLKKELSDIYWLNVSDSECPFGGIIEHTNLVPKKLYDGRSIVYLSKYLNPDHPLYKMETGEIRELYFRHLKRILPQFNEDMVEDFYVFRNRYGQPIWPMGYSKFKPSYKTPVQGLYMANTSQIYPNDRGMNFCIKLAIDAIDTFKKEEGIK